MFVVKITVTEIEDIENKVPPLNLVPGDLIRIRWDKTNRGMLIAKTEKWKGYALLIKPFPPKSFPKPLIPNPQGF